LNFDPLEWKEDIDLMDLSEVHILKFQFMLVWERLVMWYLYSSGKEGFGISCFSCIVANARVIVYPRKENRGIAKCFAGW